MATKYIYKVTLLETGEFYIGSRTSKVDPQLDTYKGSMSSWKVNKALLVKEILVVFPEGTTQATLLEHEADLIGLVVNDLLNRNYHIPTIGFSRFGLEVSDETKAKLSLSHKGKTHSDETKAKLSLASKGKSMTDEQKGKLSLSCMGRTLSAETKQKISNTTKGRVSSNKGKKASDETKQKMSTSHIGNKSHTGIKSSDETKTKISKSLIGNTRSKGNRFKLTDEQIAKGIATRAANKLKKENVFIWI